MKTFWPAFRIDCPSVFHVVSVAVCIAAAISPQTVCAWLLMLTLGLGLGLVGGVMAGALVAAQFLGRVQESGTSLETGISLLDESAAMPS